MAKQVIIGALEEVIGEYVVNIDKEKIKIAALRGKIKLENVQLDGDLLGGYILGSMGLSGFGILSCWAESIKITVPLKNLEQQPTKIEIRGCHLLCVPLLPSTSQKLYGAGTIADPRCSLRTRAKRSKLARFEKNFMSGRIEGEGPMAKRILRAVKAVEQDMKKKQRRRGSLSSKKNTEDESQNDEEDSAYFYSLVNELGRDGETDSSTTLHDSTSSLGEEKISRDGSQNANLHTNKLPELPRNWKVKLREKILRNFQASIHDFHVRCEVSEGGLDFCHPDHLKRSLNKFKASNASPHQYDQRAFAFGVTLDDFIVRTANEKWEVGKHETDSRTASTDHLGPNPYDARNNKVITWENFSMYWDDNPAFLVSETPLLQRNDGKVSSDKLHSKLASVMKALYKQQEPGPAQREMLNVPGPKLNQGTKCNPDRAHEYCWENFSYEVRMKVSKQTEPGPISCLSEFLPFVWNIRFRPHQYVQYQKLKSAMLSQQRFDTMVRQRPNQSAAENPQEWWKYAIRCITSRPNARPWEDVQAIARSRDRYIELVLKKLASLPESSGFHRGLSEEESSDLLQIEDSLPIEALLAFHLAALRLHINSPLAGQWQKKIQAPESPSRARSLTRPISRIFRGRSRRSRSQSKEPSKQEKERTLSSTKSPNSKPPKSNQKSSSTNELDSSTALVDAMKARLGKKVWMTNFKFLCGSLNVTLLSASEMKIARLHVETAGSIKLMGQGNREFFFDVTKFYIDDCQHGDGGQGQILYVEPDLGPETAPSDDLSTDSSLNLSLPPQPTCSDALSSFMDLPPNGVVCRLAASRENGRTTRLSVSAHPATLLWTRPCFDAVAEFFGAPSSALQTELSRHLQNAATPLARKAQLAFLSQSNFMLHMNVAAPKVWVPLAASSKSDSTGALFLDAGNFRISYAKKENRPHANWSIDASDIQVNFTNWGISQLRQHHLAVNIVDATNSILRPFHVRASSTTRDLDDAVVDNAIITEGPVGFVEVRISPICLNLVDAEALARSIGNWYSQGLGRVRGRNSRKTSLRVDDDEHEITGLVSATEISPAKSISIFVEKFEMALEGHSKKILSDDKSIESLDFTLFGGFSRTRTYVVEIFGINIRRSLHRHVKATTFLVNDVSVVQLHDSFDYVPMKSRHEAAEAQYCVLQRGTPRISFENHSGLEIIDGTNILRISLFHDGRMHLDEVEVDVEATILRVTPTSLKDCAKGIRRIAELVQVMTKEMERKIHEEGRKARRRNQGDGTDAIDTDISVTAHGNSSPKLSSTSDISGIENPEDTSQKLPSDSSLLLKVTVRDGTILAGRPTISSVKGNRQAKFFRKIRKRCDFAVVQILSNALVMFQSVENPDASGTKTLHVSLDDLSASVNTEFVCIPPSEQPPMIGPTGAELRVANGTENLGIIISHGIAVDCEDFKSSLTPNDLSIFVSIVKTMLQRLRGLQQLAETKSSNDISAINPKERTRPLFATYQSKGAGVATDVRIQVHSISFVVLRDFKSKYGAPEFVAFRLSGLKTVLGGCMSALSGECNAVVSVDFFNAEVSDWEYAIEPFHTKLVVDQMPNEMILDLSAENHVQLNLTGIFLRDLAELDFGSLCKGKNEENYHALTPSALNTVGLRRATESHSVKIYNLTGFDIEIGTDGLGNSAAPEIGVRFESFGPGIIKDGSHASLDHLFDNCDIQNNIDRLEETAPRLSLRIPASTAFVIGNREVIANLPFFSSSGTSRSLHILRPVSSADNSKAQAKFNGLSTRKHLHVSPESSGDCDRENFTHYHAEPVVEWCMQNQRLVSSTIDLYSLDKGRDLLSSAIWSPEEADTALNTPSTAETAITSEKAASSPCMKVALPVVRKGNWIRPYLKNDSPEWTDMTCILKMARERVMLPDSSWMWANDWKVDISGDLGEATDADGWEYQADFETFTRLRRFYVQGDCCRRRRWTRTRIVRPPQIDDPMRFMQVVWETSRDDNGNFKVEVRSNVTIHNDTSSELTFFVFSPSWDDELLVGSANPGRSIRVPVTLASAVYFRIAKRQVNGESSCLKDFSLTDHIMMIPTSYESSVWIRSSMELGDVSATKLYFLINIACKKGIVDIFIHPVLKILNLLPCELDCKLGELCPAGEEGPKDAIGNAINRKRIVTVETFDVPSGKNGKGNAVNPALKPHISIRVPGYNWSSWQRIVNRKADSHTWRPSVSEEENYIGLKSDANAPEEFKILVHFDRFGDAGDPLTLIMSVESGHCPTIRIYSQYWIVDKSGFGCRFCETFTDLLNTSPEIEYSRRSYLTKEDSRDQVMKRDMNIQGHQWSIGMSGMTMYFSTRERIAISIERAPETAQHSGGKMQTRWTPPMDISNVMPKTIFSVDEVRGQRRFEFAISVTVAPGLFSRTRIINLIPRYQIVNLLKRLIVVAQEGCLQSETIIHSNTTVPFHWEKRSISSKIRLGAPTNEERDARDYEECWSNGRIQLDKVGITAIRLPSSGILPSKPMVVQAEVRLASKDQTSAVVIVLWSATENSNPLYLLRNQTSHTILCRQPLHDDQNEVERSFDSPLKQRDISKNDYHCGKELGPILRAFLGLESFEEFVWVLRSGDTACFGFDDPEKAHILEWSYIDTETLEFDETCSKARVEIDAMGSWSMISLGGGKEVRCQIGAVSSTKTVDFFETNSTKFSRALTGLSHKQVGVNLQDILEQERRDDLEGEEEVSFSFRVIVPSLCISVIDNIDPDRHGREILLTQFDNIFSSFSQSREGYHELEFRLATLQVDNHVPGSIHPVLFFCPKISAQEPFIQLSAVRRLQSHSSTYVFRYMAFRMLDVNLFLDRRTAEAIARFIEPVRMSDESWSIDSPDFVASLTIEMAMNDGRPLQKIPTNMEKIVQTANSGRIYFEQLHLHPIRIALTFTQEWGDLGQRIESLMVFQFIRGMASIADAPLTFTSFVVDHVFESPQTLFRVIATHYSSQLTKQIFAILGSLAILGAPADFISNVGTGVRDFFYEPIQGAVHGPRQFIEGLEAGTQSLARGVFVGVVRGAANVTEVVNTNLAGLTADDDFIDERKAHQRMLTDAMSRGITSRTINDSLYLAGASIARGLRSGALGVVEQPTRYASKHGPVGFVKGMGKAFIGAIVKPVVGVGDAAALLMNHVSDATSKRQILPKIPKRLRRALPSRSAQKPNCVILTPYDDNAAKAQKIVTGGESIDDVYIGHVNIPSHLIIASGQCFWAIDKRSREPWCISWEEISHFGSVKGGVRIVVFSTSGLKPFVFLVENIDDREKMLRLLRMQVGRMGNANRNLHESTMSDIDISLHDIPGVRSRQTKHVFGSCNQFRKRLDSTIKDEIDLIEQCFGRVKFMNSKSSRFFETLDEEAWSLVSCWGQVFSGLSSRRCIAASVINGTGRPIQIKSTKLMEGGSPCYSIPTSEFDADQGVLHAGGAIIFFGWGVVPSLLQAGNVFMHVETNAFIANLSDQKSRDTYSESLPGYRVAFLEKSYDEAGWWAKYWLLVRQS